MNGSSKPSSENQSAPDRLPSRDFARIPGDRVCRNLRDLRKSIFPGRVAAIGPLGQGGPSGGLRFALRV